MSPLTPTELATVQGYRYWAKFVAICSYIFLGFNAAGIAAYSVFLIFTIFGIIMLPFYWFFAGVPVVIGFICALKLHASTAPLRTLDSATDPRTALVQSLESLRQGLKLYGIYQAVILGLIATVIAGLILLVIIAVSTGETKWETDLDTTSESWWETEWDLEESEEYLTVKAKQGRIEELESEIDELESEISNLESDSSPLSF